MKEKRIFGSFYFLSLGSRLGRPTHRLDLVGLRSGVGSRGNPFVWRGISGGKAMNNKTADIGCRSVSLAEFKGRQTGSSSQSAPKVARARQVERFCRPPFFADSKMSIGRLWSTQRQESGPRCSFRPNFGRSDETASVGVGWELGGGGGIDTIRNKKKKRREEMKGHRSRLACRSVSQAGKISRKTEDGAVTGSVMRRADCSGRFVVGRCCR